MSNPKTESGLELKLHQLSRHVYYSENDPARDRPVLGCICGSERSVMVDAGNSAAHNARFLELLEKAGLKKPDLCVITHWHWDHTFGIHALDMETYAQENTNQKLRELSAWEWSDSAMKARLTAGVDIPFADEHIRAEYADLSAIRVVPAGCTIREELIIPCGAVTCRCLHLPSAHSDDAVVVHIPEEGVLFIGDIYGDDFYREHYRDLQKTRELHRALKELDFAWAVPGHSAPLPKERLLGYLAGFLT